MATKRFMYCLPLTHFFGRQHTLKLPKRADVLKTIVAKKKFSIIINSFACFLKKKFFDSQSNSFEFLVLYFRQNFSKYYIVRNSRAPLKSAHVWVLQRSKKTFVNPRCPFFKRRRNLQGWSRILNEEMAMEMSKNVILLPFSFSTTDATGFKVTRLSLFLTKSLFEITPSLNRFKRCSHFPQDLSNVGLWIIYFSMPPWVMRGQQNLWCLPLATTLAKNGALYV